MRKNYILTICIGLLSYGALAQKYVKPTGTGNADGTSWANASGNLQAMINASTVGGEVWVAAGTYKPTEKLLSTSTDNRDKTFILKAGVKIYGGFDGTELTLAEQNPIANLTILSGDLNNDNIASTGDAYHVVASAGSSTGAVLDGFTIQHGYADVAGTVSGVEQNQGGGINITNEETSIIFSNLIIKNNESTGTVTSRGGGVHLSLSNTSNVVFDHVVFDTNKSKYSGGAIYFTSTTGSPTVTVSNSKIFRGGGTSGAGLYVIGTAGNVSNFKVFNSIFAENRASNTPGGGALYLAGYTNSDVVNCTFYNNSNTNGALSYNNASNTVLNLYNSIFNGNTKSSSNTAAADVRNITGATLDFRNNLFQLSPIEDTDPEYNNIINNTPTALFLSTASSDPNFLKLVEGAATQKGANSYASGITKDLAGETRIVHTTIDLGAYEFQGTLPVELVVFNAKKNNNGVELDWEVASELDNEKFIIERSNNGKVFETLGQVYSKGNTNNNVEYTYKDSSPLSGENYYKLYQKDRNGAVKLLGIKVLSFGFSESFILYPNPASNLIKIQLDGLNSSNMISIQLSSLAGSAVLSKSINKKDMENEISLNVSKFPRGVYVLVLTDGKTKIKRKVILN